MRAVPLAPDVASALAQLGRRENWIGDDDLVFAGEAVAIWMARRCAGATRRRLLEQTSDRCVSTTSVTPLGPE